MADKNKAVVVRPNKDVAIKADEETLAMLRESFPVNDSPAYMLLPRLGMFSQDVTEGKGKAMKVISEAGTFYIDRQTDEVDEDNKKLWEKTELGNEIEGIIIFERRQLKFYDGEKYTSSPIYDSEDEIIPLFRDRKEVDRGTPAELKAKPEYQGTTAKGKPTSKLEDNKILYVLYEGALHQMNIRGTSMYAYQAYRRRLSPNTVLTRFNSVEQENGATSWNQMTFQDVRVINSEEAKTVVELIKMIQQGVESSKTIRGGEVEETEADKKFKNF